MIRVRQGWFLDLTAALFCACAVLFPVRALGQTAGHKFVTPVTDFDSAYSALVSDVRRAGPFQLELHFEPGAVSTREWSADGSGLVPKEWAARDYSGERIVLIVSKWLDLPQAAQMLLDTTQGARGSRTVIAVVTDAKDHLTDGMLPWPKHAKLADLVDRVYAPVDLGGPERVASSATTLFFAAAKSRNCEQKVANVWGVAPGAWGVSKDQKPVGFSATAELLLRSAKANASTMRGSSLVIHLPASFAAGGAQAYSEFSSTGAWLETSMAERVALGLGTELLPKPRNLEVSVNVPVAASNTQDAGARLLVSWQDFKVDYLRADGVASYLSESVLQGNQPGSLNESATLAVQDWTQTIQRDPLQAEGNYQKRVEIITRDAARRLERAQAFGRFVELLAVEVKERALPTASLSFGAGSSQIVSNNAVIPVNWVPTGSTLPSTKSVTFGEYRTLLDRAIEASARINAIELKTPKPYRLPNDRRAR